MKTVVKKYFNNLFQHEESMNGKSRRIKNLPEDICFFIDKKLLLGTVSHEVICFLYPPDKDIANQFMPLGTWEKGTYRSDEHIDLDYVDLH